MTGPVKLERQTKRAE